MTVVAGPDPVNTTFLNFMAVQDDTAKVGRGRGVVPGEPPPPLPSRPSLSERLLCAGLSPGPISNHPLTKQDLSFYCVPDLLLGVGCGKASPAVPHSPPPPGS